MFPPEIWLKIIEHANLSDVATLYYTTREFIPLIRHHVRKSPDYPIIAMQYALIGILDEWEIRIMTNTTGPRKRWARMDPLPPPRSIKLFIYPIINDDNLMFQLIHHYGIPFVDWLMKRGEIYVSSYSLRHIRNLLNKTPQFTDLLMALYIGHEVSSTISKMDHKIRLWKNYNASEEDLIRALPYAELSSSFPRWAIKMGYKKLYEILLTKYKCGSPTGVFRYGDERLCRETIIIHKVEQLDETCPRQHHQPTAEGTQGFSRDAAGSDQQTQTYIDMQGIP